MLPAPAGGHHVASLMIPPNVNAWSWHLRVNVLAASHRLGPPRRGQLLRAAGVGVSEDATIQAGCFFFGADAAIGAGSWIGHRCYFDTRSHIEIGDRCDLGMEVMLCTSGHRVGPADRRAGDYVAEPIIVGDGSWLGTRAVVLGGVTIAQGCVVAAGAVVVSDCEPHGLYAGVPARRLRDLTA
jgi:maltose O-acetyltransferase